MFEQNDEHRPKYALDQPYAPAQVTAVNTQYAAILMNNYASAFGELTTINTYNYQSMMIQSVNSDLSTALQSGNAPFTFAGTDYFFAGRQSALYVYAKESAHLLAGAYGGL